MTDKHQTQANAQAGYERREDIVFTKHAPDLATWQPETAGEFLQRGWIHYTLREYDKAIADITRSLELEADDPEAYYLLGLTYKATARVEDARSAFDQTINHLDRIQNPARRVMLTRLIGSQNSRMDAGIIKPEV